MKTGSIFTGLFLSAIIVLCSSAVLRPAQPTDKGYEIIFKSPEIIKLTLREVKGGTQDEIVINSKYNYNAPKFTVKPTRLNELNQQRSDNTMDPGTEILASGVDQKRRAPEDDLSQSKNAAKTIEITSYSVITGNFTNVFKRATDKVSTTDFQGVTFPFRINMMFENYSAEILITKPGNWTIDANISSE